jgi:hypothetical protein
MEAEVGPEETRRPLVQNASIHELTQRRGRLVGRIELQHRIRPQLALVELVPDEGLDPLVVDVDEARET